MFQISFKIAWQLWRYRINIGQNTHLAFSWIHYLLFDKQTFTKGAKKLSSVEDSFDNTKLRAAYGKTPHPHLCSKICSRNYRVKKGCLIVHVQGLQQTLQFWNSNSANETGITVRVNLCTLNMRWWSSWSAG